MLLLTDGVKTMRCVCVCFLYVLLVVESSTKPLWCKNSSCECCLTEKQFPVLQNPGASVCVADSFFLWVYRSWSFSFGQVHQVALSTHHEDMWLISINTYIFNVGLVVNSVFSVEQLNAIFSCLFLFVWWLSYQRLHSISHISPPFHTDSSTQQPGVKCRKW